MPFRNLSTIVTIVLLLTGSLWAQNWEGTWNTQFGQLRLVDLGDYVVGDYSKHGIIIGKKNFDLLQGVFTNSQNQRSGHFTFQSQPSNRFRGSYKWEGSNKLTDWTGQKTSNTVTALRNFTLDGKAIPVSQNYRSDYDGVYNSSFGQLRLRQKHNILFGDYGKVGVLAGVWNGNHFVGRFTNNGKVGWFRFDFFSKDASFRSGQFGWLPVGPKAGSWNLAKTNQGTPALYQVYKPSGSNTASVEADKVDKNPNRNGGNNQNQNQNNSQPTPPAPTYLPISTPKVFDAAFANCAVSQQEHVSYVSKRTENEVEDALKDNGWTLINSVITSESNDPYISKLTTDRLRAYVATRGNDIVICFRGSKASRAGSDTSAWKTLLNGLTDVTAVPVRPSFLNSSSMGWSEGQNVKVHVGFNRAYARLRPAIWSAVQSIPNRKQKKLFVFGHSLGGAQATLCALDFGTNMNRKFKGIAMVVSGCPRVGTPSFGPYFNKYLGLAYRIEIKGDLVPMLPPQRIARVNAFEHVGDLLALTNNGNVIEPEDITKRPVIDGVGESGLHANTNYLRVVRAFQQKSQRSGFFNGRSSYLKKAGAAERRLR